MTVKPKQGGRRAGSGRKKGGLNKSTASLKVLASEYTEEAVMVLVDVMRDADSPPSVKIQAADKLLDRGHGRPATTVEPVEINLNIFPPKEVLDGIYAKALAEAAKRDLTLVGRRERLGIICTEVKNES